MKIETSKLINEALDYAVAIAKGAGTVYIGKNGKHCLATARYSTDWSAGGPIIECENISLDRLPDNGHRAFIRTNDSGNEYITDCWNGATKLQTAMRCYVASKLGEFVEIPDELTK